MFLEQKIFFGVISSRQKLEASNSVAEIEVRLLNHEHILQISSEFNGISFTVCLANESLVSDQQATKGENLLLQVRGHFFTSAESVLQSIQSHSSTTLPFLENFAYGKSTLTPPAYVTPRATYFDLSHLVKPDILFK